MEYSKFPDDAPPPYPGGNAYNLTRSQTATFSNEELVPVDFLPVTSKSGGLFSLAEYELFPAVVEHANEWLSTRPAMQLVTCETVKFNTTSSGAIRNSANSITGIAFEEEYYVRGLRLWMRTKADGSTVSQQIGYYNIVPSVDFAATGPGTGSHFIRADRLDTIIANANRKFADDPIAGTILTTETIAVHVEPNGTVNPDRSAWRQSGPGGEIVGTPLSAYHFDTQNGIIESYVYALRVFFITGAPAYESIGIADFIPTELLQGTSASGRPLLENFTQVLAKAHRWAMEQPPHIRITNVQTMEILSKSAIGPDTLAAAYSEREAQGYFVKHLRVGFVSGGMHAPSRSGPTMLNCKLFVPRMLLAPGCCSWSGKFELQAEVHERVSGWVKTAGVNLISVETVPMRILSGAEQSEGFGTMHTWGTVREEVLDEGVKVTRRFRVAEKYLIMYRVYFDGVSPNFTENLEKEYNIEAFMRTRTVGACAVL